MKDLRSQLLEKFGGDSGTGDSATTHQTVEAEPPSSLPDVLDDWSHLETPWIKKMRFYRSVPGVGAISARPKLATARQLTDRIAKALKKQGRSGEAKSLIDLRERFLQKRNKSAWKEVKSRFSALSLSERAYRSLKQQGVDPVVVLARLIAADDGSLSGMGADKLVERLR